MNSSLRQANCRVTRVIALEPLHYTRRSRMCVPAQRAQPIDTKSVHSRPSLLAAVSVANVVPSEDTKPDAAMTNCRRVGPANLPLSALRIGRLDTDRTYAVKASKLIASIKAPTTHRNLASRESEKPAGGGPSWCRFRTPLCYLVPVGDGRSRDSPHRHGLFQLTIGRPEIR